MSISNELLLHSMVLVGGLMALPWLFQISRILGRMLVLYFHPITTIDLEISEDNGIKTRKSVKLSNTSELAQAIIDANKLAMDGDADDSKKVVGHDN